MWILYRISWNPFRTLASFPREAGRIQIAFQFHGKSLQVDLAFTGKSGGTNAQASTEGAEQKLNRIHGFVCSSKRSGFIYSQLKSSDPPLAVDSLPRPGHGSVKGCFGHSNTSLVSVLDHERVNSYSGNNNLYANDLKYIKNSDLTIFT